VYASLCVKAVRTTSLLKIKRTPSARADTFYEASARLEGRSSRPRPLPPLESAPEESEELSGEGGGRGGRKEEFR
jgi:hypothetical protein